MKKLLGLCVSAAILALLYAWIDVAGLARAMRAADPAWLATGLLFVVPLTLLTSWRLTLLVRGYRLGFLESNRLVLAASTLNLFLPSKLGDLAKGHVLARRHGMEPGLAFSVVVLEKALDMMSLLLWGVLGLLVVGQERPVLFLFLAPVGGGLALMGLLVGPFPFLPFLLRHFGRLMPARIAAALAGFSSSWETTTRWFWRRGGGALGVTLLSVAIWGAHLLQFWVFARALGATVPVLQNAAFATLSILVGLLPFTFAGVGTRDAAIVFFYARYLDPAAGAVLGMLATLRYVLPAIAGAPFVGDFIGLRGLPGRMRAAGGEDGGR
ncbi:lysylphosphatidylglycerol synthase transmembrane domain-containing protein [Propylenella binzhouense]|uniref:Flippase-like domain-containing protein n=1 Tax=Propylenella binzhouense TaxID=2555902 RepID=A0A964WVP7_9HYPH|nr:lysylphosphatidylglycerol synthase transmembrane domain-containing protein [Propylenella binzhouense]MYZ50406.1 flippase-like domain-containing protein [Propylenella binzhouense]